MDPNDIDVNSCRGRQARLIEEMRTHDVDLVIVTQIEHVQWLTGPRDGWVFQPAAALSIDGHAVLVAPSKPPELAAADDVLTYEAKWHSTLRNDQRFASTQILLSALKNPPKRIGVEFSSFGQHLATSLDAEFVDIEPTLFRLRRHKDPDELARIRKAIAATGKMYKRAREIIEPGISELHVFNELQSAAVESLGEMLTDTGNDYQCCSRGGPPRANHKAQAGELYILDLGPAFRGYFADNCRTIAVSEVSEAQQQAWEHVVGVFSLVQERVKPGVSAKHLFLEAQQLLDKSKTGVFNHHLGHGIGLFPHESPHLNPNWDDTFEVGDVFTAEPGLYAPELRAGMRVENNYLVTETGVELLSDFPLELL